MSDAHLSFKLDLPNGVRIGPGKIALLLAIKETGSISAAARKIGMSYRRAWLLIEELNTALEKPAVEAAPGGSHGGGAKLTSSGIQIIEIYQSIEASTRTATKDEFRLLNKLTRKTKK